MPPALFGMNRTGAEPAFDRITALAAGLFGVPVALVTFIDDRMQWVKAKVGTDYTQGPRRETICRFVVDDPSHSILVVEDLAADPRFADNPHVVTGGFRFYAGAPLVTADGLCIGTLCILDRVPRHALTPVQQAYLAQLAAIVADEVELRRLYRASEEARRLLEIAEGVLGVGHWRYVLKSDHVVWSEQVYRIHGVDPATYNPNLTGGIDFYLPDDRVRVVEALQRAISTKSGFDFELNIRRADGDVRTVLSKATCETDDTGEVVAVFGIFQDVTDKRTSLDELTRARLAIETSGEVQSSFLANMSHELRTPLNSIIGFTEILRDTIVPGSDQMAFLSHIEAAGKSLLALIDDVLDLAKLEAGRMEIKAKPFEPLTLASQTLASVAPQAEKKGLLLRFEPTSTGDRTLLGDPDRLRQVLLNLLSNAIKFTKTGSVTLRLGLRPKADDVELLIDVEDTGIGISSDKIGQLFKRFGQVRSKGQEHAGGTGLGLAISKSIVHAMGGELSVRSRPGDGSVFTVRVAFPAAPKEGASAGEPAQSPISRPLRAARRILVAEDLAINRELIRVMLAPLGCDIDFAVDGEECLRKVQAADYAVILMDVRMPQLDGYAASRMIKSLGGRLAAIPILALTASAMPEDAQRCRDAGMADVITKPIARRDLEAKVRHWAERPDAR